MPRSSRISKYESPQMRAAKTWQIVNRLLGIILKHRRGCIVEIGMGLSTLVLAKHAKRAERILYSCDIRKKIGKLFPNHIVVLKKSIDFIKEFQDSPVATVFIDGLHESGTVREEVHFFLPLMVEGGVIFMHDTLPPDERFLAARKCGDVWKIRSELEKDPAVDCFTWPYTASNVGLTMVMRKPEERFKNDHASHNSLGSQ